MRRNIDGFWTKLQHNLKEIMAGSPSMGLPSEWIFIFVQASVTAALHPRDREAEAGCEPF